MILWNRKKRNLLVSPDAIEYFRQAVMRAAIAIWNDGDIDDIELSDVSEGRARRIHTQGALIRWRWRCEVSTNWETANLTLWLLQRFR